MWTYKERKWKMKTTNFTDRNSSAGVGVLYYLALVFCFTFTGCGDEVLTNFSKLEEEASKYGTVSVGAVRVIEYDQKDLEESRKRLSNALLKMWKDVNDVNMVPQVYGADLATKFFTAIIGLNLPKDSKTETVPNPPDTSTYLNGLSQAFNEMIKKNTPRPSEIELTGLRMAALKFIESEIENLKLSSVYPVDSDNYRRVVISLDLTAWVRGEAKATLVYVDLYPYKADSWCHRASKVLDKWLNDTNEANEQIYAKEWKDVTEEELGAAFCLSKMSIQKLPKKSTIKEADKRDLVAFCHNWLTKNKHCSRIVHVERMGQTEYSILAEGLYSGTEFQLGGIHPAGVSGSVKIGSGRTSKGLKAKTRPLSLAFVAGERRAGWLFMPSKTEEEDKMPPTERRLRMVVDIPENASKLAIHIHKAFLDANFGILSNASFKKQMDDMDLARQILTQADKWYEKSEERDPSCPSPGHYRLRKSRMRNLLYQGWSEEIVVDIPTERIRGQ
jgi:hypothetical protein